MKKGEVLAYCILAGSAVMILGLYLNDGEGESLSLILGALIMGYGFFKVTKD